YSAVPPSPTQIYSSPKKDLSWTSLPEFKDDTVTDYSRPAPTIKSSPEDAQNRNPSVTETKASTTAISPKSFIMFVKANDSPSNSKTDKAKTAKKPLIKYAKQYRKSTKKPNVKGNQRNWNNLKSHQLGPNFEMKKNACFNCGDFNHLAYDCRKKVKHGTSRSQIYTHKSFTPRPDVHKPYRPPMRPMRSNMNGAWPNRTSFNKPTHSYTNRPFQRTSAVISQYRAPWVPTVNRNFPPVNSKFSTVSRNFSTVNGKFPTANRKFPTGGTKFSTADMGKKGKAVKPSAYLKYNLFSVSQICDNKNSVLFTDSECIVLGQNFKLSNDDNVLVRTSKQHNMYSIDLNNIVTHKDLTCLVAKASADECMLWHRRLVRGLPTKCFENDHTCTACLKGKQHKASYEPNEVEADVSNMEITITASPTPTLRIHKDHPKSQIIGPMDTPIQTRNKSKDIFDALQDPSWVEAMQEELLQFKIQNVWTLVDCPKGVRPIGTKWVLKNKKVERGIVIKNKARLVAQGHTQEEGIDYDEVFAPVARIKAIRLFIAYASFMGFIVYQMDVKSAFLYGSIDEEVYVMQPPRFQDPEYPAKLYKVEKAIEFEALMHEKFQMSAMGELNFFLGLQVLQKEDGIFLSQDKYVGDILKKFRHQVTPKECHLHAVKRIFGYLKGHPKLGLWYPKESPFDLVAYSDSDYGGATQDRKSTTGGCQFLGRRLISWESKKQTIVATSTTEAEYVAAASCCGEVLWIQNQLLDYGLSMPCEALSREISSSILRFLRLILLGEGSGTPIEPHHIPSPEAYPTSHTTHSSPTLPLVTTASIPTVTPSETTPIRQYTRRARIALSSAVPPIANKPASPLRDVSEGEAFPTDSGFVANQDRATIAKTFTLPHDSTPRVTSPAAAEAVCNKLLINYQLSITACKCNIQKRSRDDAPIKGRNFDEGEAEAERVSDDVEEMETVLTSMDAATVLASGVAEVPIGSGSIPTAGSPATEVPTGSDVVPTAKSETPKKKKVQEQIDAQVIRELEEQMAREDQRMSEQEYEQFVGDLLIGKRAELINNLIKYQENYAKILKFHTQQRNPWSKKQKRDYYMAVIKSNLGWKVKDFRGMTFEETEAKFTTVWKQLKDFIPMGSKEEAERLKRKCLSLEQESVKKLKTLEEVAKEAKSPDEVPEEKDKEISMLVEKDYPLRKGLEIVMICYKLQVENYS
nr:hypothetical protein [Tanacetum cinerariifolium]